MDLLEKVEFSKGFAFITCVILVATKSFMVYKYTWRVFLIFFIGTKNTYAFSHGENETDDEAIYGNAETIFQQNDNSDNSEDEYVNVNGREEEEEQGSDYEIVEDYAKSGEYC